MPAGRNNLGRMYATGRGVSRGDAYCSATCSRTKRNVRSRPWWYPGRTGPCYGVIPTVDSAGRPPEFVTPGLTPGCPVSRSRAILGDRAPISPARRCHVRRHCRGGRGSLRPGDPVVLLVDPWALPVISFASGRYLHARFFRAPATRPGRAALAGADSASCEPVRRRIHGPASLCCGGPIIAPTTTPTISQSSVRSSITIGRCSGLLLHGFSSTLSSAGR